MVLNPMPRCSMIKNRGKRANIIPLRLYSWDVGHQGSGGFRANMKTQIYHEICKHMERFITNTGPTATLTRLQVIMRNQQTFIPEVIQPALL
jgi:hypothetical protein